MRHSSIEVFLSNLIMDGCERSWPTPPVTKVGSVDKRKRPRAVHSAQCRGKWWRCCKISKEPTAIFSLPADLPVIWCFLVGWHSGPVSYRLGWVGMGWDGMCKNGNSRHLLRWQICLRCKCSSLIFRSSDLHWPARRNALILIYINYMESAKYLYTMWYW